uniref:Uncharacterized protein n=2 Tax=Canis lupus familiaris TaxID=9615 RepID=A0A8C0RPX5_CANLF
MAWHCPLGATRPQGRIGPCPSHRCWVTRAIPCSAGCSLDRCHVGSPSVPPTCYRPSFPGPDGPRSQPGPGIGR